MKSAVIVATLGAIALGLAPEANAGTLLFSYVESGGIDFSFYQSSTPTPIFYNLGGDTDVPISQISGNIGPYSDIVWYSAPNYGLFNTPDNAYVVFGPQIYTGPESAPVFAPGVFVGADQSNGLSGTLTVTAVPEPASWALMLVGFGGLGAAIRRSRRATAGDVAVA